MSLAAGKAQKLPGYQGRAACKVNYMRLRPMQVSAGNPKFSTLLVDNLHNAVSRSGAVRPRFRPA